jgi:excisionase family DNA binding protein
MSTSPVAHATASSKATDLATEPRAGLNENRDGRLLTIPEVAQWLGVSKAWVYDHSTRKKPFLPCVRFGELTRFRRDEIERFIQEHTSMKGSPR